MRSLSLGLSFYKKASQILYFNLFFFILLFTFQAFSIQAQDLGLPPETCPNTDIPLTTPVVSSPRYYWDMCANNDLLNTPTVELLRASMPNSFRSEGIHTVWDEVNNNWYGFVTNREGGGSSNTLLRLNFGADLRGLPTYESLGNVGGLLNSPKGIKFIKANGVWFGFIMNRTARNIIRLNFGNNLGNYPVASVVNVPLWTSNNSAFLDVVYDAPYNRYIIVQVDFGNAIQIINFGTDLESTPTILRFNAPVSFVFGMSLINYMGNWYGLTHGGGGTDTKMNLINFGTDMMSGASPVYMPLIYGNSFSIINGESWQACQLMQDGANLVGFIISNFGTLVRLNFRTNPNAQPIYTKLGNFGLFAQSISLPNGQSTTANSSLNFSIIDSQWVGFTINRTTGVANGNNLYRMIFPNVCDATPKLSEVANPKVQFRNPGKKYITHTAYNTDRNPISNNYMYVDSTVVKDAVVAEFQALEKCLGEATIFNNISQGNLTQASGWLWDFGNGQTSTQYAPTFTYTQAGNYTVKLKVTNFSGCVNEFVQNIRISKYPNANFKINQMNCTSRTVDFEDISTLSSTDITQGGQIFNRFWTFGDGTTYLTAPINITNLRKGDFNAPFPQGSTPFLANNTPYPANDRYIVGLAITDDAGCVSSSYRTISFNPDDAPVPDFTMSVGCAGSFMYFYDQSVASATNFTQATQWKWRIFNASNQKIDSSSLQNPSFLISLVGNYTAELEVRGDFTCSKKIKKTFTVQNGTQSQFRASTLSGGVPLTVSFTSLTPNASRHQWAFGNGFVSTQVNPVYTFTQKGSYTVTYQALNSNNCGALVSQLVIVGDAPTALPDDVLPNNDFWVYPNPVKDFLQISPNFLKNVTEIRYDLVDLHGRIIIQGELSKDNNHINTQMLGKSVYFLRCEAKNPQNTSKKTNWVVKVVVEN